jgi:hypothetical protein
MTRLLAVLALMSASAAMGSAVGDSYAKVIAENGQPKSALEAGSMRILVYATVTIKVRDDVVISIKENPAESSAPEPTRPPSPPSADEIASMPAADQVNALKLQIKNAVDRVVAIVNQPVPTVPLTAELGAGVWDNGWFHPGAVKPDFDHVDIRNTQETDSYSKFNYVTSNLNPGVAFPGSEIEFNTMTKFFYRDRTLPKKRLSMQEMVEVNRLYRIIGAASSRLAALGAVNKP